MSKKKRSVGNPFFINGTRAMISLGPLNEKRHCSFSCAFCYVQDEFVSYANLEIDEIVSFLKVNRDKYSIIYVSGDTDSFAPPRTNQGLMLLYKIVMEIDCDLLFTTRTTFNEQQYEILDSVFKEQKRKNRKIYACVSITRYSKDLEYIEPYPIPTPDRRIDTIRELKELGAVTVLAIRPFLPIVPITDYLKIIDKAKEYTDIVLGESFYFVRNGNVQKRIFPDGISKEIEANILQSQKMSFDDNNAEWEIWNSVSYQNIIKNKCEENNLIFAMHSDDGIKQYLDKEKN